MMYVVGTGNSRDFYTLLLYCRKAGNQDHPRNIEAWAYAGVCQWLERISTETDEQRLDRLAEVARKHADPFTWDMKWKHISWLESGVSDLNALREKAGNTEHEVTIDDVIMMCEDYQSFERASLSKMERDYSILEYSLRKRFPHLLGLLPTANVRQQSRPSDSEIMGFCDRCRAIEAGLLLEKGKLAAVEPTSLHGTAAKTDEGIKDQREIKWTPKKEVEARRLINEGEITKAGQLPEKMKMNRKDGLALYRFITGTAKKPHRSE